LSGFGAFDEVGLVLETGEGTSGNVGNVTVLLDGDKAIGGFTGLLKTGSGDRIISIDSIVFGAFLAWVLAILVIDE
jgi:hypothetical protein